MQQLPLVTEKEPELASDELRAMYRLMRKIRTVDQRMISLQRQGRIAFHGLSQGEEAAIVGSAFALKPQDWVFPGLRDSGVMLHRGWPLRRFVAQSMGNAEDPLSGRMQPCHFADRSVNQVTWSSTIATQLPHAVGAAYGMKRARSNAVAMAYLGDGATSSAEFHTAANFAGVWKVPVVFFIQNNQWAISVPLSAQTASATLAEKSVAYGIPGVRVDGNDVLAVYDATRRAVDAARMGAGPTLVEAVTYRRSGHSSSDDPSRYRDEAEGSAWERQDPIDRFRSYLAARALWTDADERRAEAEIAAELDDAVAHNEKAPAVALSTLIENVYGEVPWNLREQFDVFLSVCGDDFVGSVEGRFPL